MHDTDTLHQWFNGFVRKQPSAPAVITDTRVLSYAELDSAAAALARQLHGRGLGRQEAVGVLVERSADLPAAFLAILKSGGVYVPMVANLPAERLAGFARHADMRRLIVLDGLKPPAALVDALIGNGANDASDAILRPGALPAEPPAEEPTGPRAAMTDLAAILFTSGSTGTPKGVMLPHGACVNLARGHIAAHAIRPADRVLLSTSPGFILGFRELCLPLMSGAAYVAVSRATLDAPDQLLALMGRQRVSIALFTPSYLRLLNGAVPHGLRCILTAGERPNVDDARYYARHVEYWNVHGATEMCGTICMHRVDPDGTGPLPSGRPFLNTTVCLLDEKGHAVPEGQIGEIHAVGPGIARGYLKQPELTARSFVETRYGRAFRTHDLGRWNAAGELLAVGRADDVVKVSGQSVALGEIEGALARHPDVRRAVAFQMTGRLVACVETADPERLQEEDWRAFLSRSLAAYMIPAQVAALAALPISSAGKVDRQAMMAAADAIFERRERQREQGTPPRGDLETAIAGVWEELLDRRPVMREDNFFTIGGTSLLAIAVSQRLQNLGHSVTVQQILATLTVAALAARILADQAPDPAALEAPLESAATVDQHNFWIAAEMGLAPAAAHIARVLRVDGQPLATEAWQAAWARLIDHHAALRTGFYAVGDGRVHWRTLATGERPPQARLAVDRCRSLDAARDLVARRAEERFCLDQPPLVRAGLIRIETGGAGARETLFWFVLHHAVVDGTSARQMQEDLLALLGGRTLPPAPHGIAAASRAEQSYLASGRAAHDRDFWRQRLDPLAERHREAFDAVVTERSRPAVPSGRGAPPLVERLDAGTCHRLGRLAKTHGASLHALLLAILAAEMRRRCGLGHVIIGSGISLRPAGAERAIGHFVNVLPVLIEAAAQAPFGAQLRATQAALTATVAHAAYPAGLLFREFRRRHPGLRAASSTSLFDIALTAIPPRTCRDGETGLDLTPRPLPGEQEHPSAGLDLSFSHEPCQDGGLNLHLAWNPDVCSPETAQAWLAALGAWAHWLAKAAGRGERPLPTLLPHEALLLKRLERGARRPRKAQRAHEIFEQWADERPQHPAIVGPGQVETFAQLDARANGLAQRLLHECPGAGLGQTMGRGTPVAVLTSGSADLPAAVLGIWKAGGAYLPLPHNLPPARLAAMAADAGASLLVVLDGLPVPELLADTLRVQIRPQAGDASDRRPRVAGSPEDVAYIIYTSGTTGAPKGAPVTHAGYVNAILGVAETVGGLLPEDRMALAASVGFDASLWELGQGLLGGIALVPVSPALRDDPWQLKRYYRELGVTIAFHTPSYLRLSEQLPFEGMRILFTGGEAPTRRDAARYADRLAFWNCYGPTEASILVSMVRLGGAADRDAAVTVGGPLPNTRISLRRDDGTRVPPGAPGEVWLAGMGLARDYLNRPELSAERFVTTPEGRFYRSGDRACWMADGHLRIIGRNDDQIKLNGQRVEPGEIEQTLRTHPAVADAVVLVEEAASGNKTLRAFVRCEAPSPSEGALAAFLAERLPVHMCPAGITPVAAMPLNASGKLDRKALLALVRQQREAQPQEAPQGEGEQCVAGIWEEVLGVCVARHDNFFALGGNSLLAVAIAHRVSARLVLPVSARLLFEAPTLAAFVAKMPSAAAAPSPAQEPPPTELATEGQREFWTAQVAGLDTRTFIIPVHFGVAREIDTDRWQRAWSALVARHEALRTFFEVDAADRLLRRIAQGVPTALEFEAAPDRAAALAHIRQRQAAPLAMDTAPLWRVGLVDVQADGTRFFWMALHHAIGDGQSVGLLCDELATLLADGALAAPGGHAGLFAAREQAYLASADAAHDAQYWCDQLAGTPAAAFDEWPLDRPRSPQTPPGNHRLELCLDGRTSAGLKALARRHAVSLHALMLALVALEAGRRGGRADLLVGTTASLRDSAADARTVGYHVNMLPLHLRPSPDQPFGELLRTAQQRLAEALQHARLPFAHIYRAFWTARPGVRHPQRYPLFDIAVTENPASGQTPGQACFTRAIPATQTVRYERTAASPGQDMVLIHEDRGADGLLLQWHVNAAIYREETARNWFAALTGWARWLAEDSARAGQPLPRLLPEEGAQLALWEPGETIGRPHLRFEALFEAMVDRPGQAARPAVMTSAEVISYEALDARANALAHALAQGGVARGDVVAVLSGRSAHLPAAVLAVWKAGATYLPLACDLPGERLAFMVRDARAAHLIALDGAAIPAPLAAELPAALRPETLSEAFCREHRLRLGTVGRPDDAAYILYTSGSTGEPKGTLIGHAGYVNLVLSAVASYDLGPADRCLMFAAPSFDVSLSDIGVPLAGGAAICPAPYAVVASPRRLLDFLERLAITVADITPTYLRLFEGAPLPSALRVLITGGEPPVPADVRTYAPRLRYYNAYGPTENTITSSMGRLHGDPADARSAGRPLPNTSAHICDPQGDPLPPGMVGEIWLGGVGLAQGYMNRPALTAAGFTQTPQGRRYRTGDLGRWRADGTLEIVGRIDDQIKLNGIRIELGEIEHALAAHPAISQAVALLATQAGEAKSLWAVVRPAPGQAVPASERWRAHLAERLPAYMIPSGLVPVEVIPLTPSGKVDRAALIALLADGAAPTGATPPQDDLERRVAEVWGAVLGRTPIHREDNFFALGGHSLLAIAMAQRLEHLLAREVAARDLFAEPTLAGFAQRIRDTRPSPSGPAAASDRATEGQGEFWTAERAGRDTSGFNIPLTLAVSGPLPAVERWRAAWEALIARHPALRTGFYEDDGGVLRRLVVAHLDWTLEWQTAPSINAALADIRRRQTEPFAMAGPGLWRTGLIRVAESGQTLFWFVMHHAVCDGLSLGILIDELTALLRGAPLPAPSGDFNRAAAGESAYLESDRAQADAAFWRATLAGLVQRAPEALAEWPLDTPRPNAQSAGSRHGSHCFRFGLDSATAHGLRHLAGRNGASLHALMLALFSHEVRRRTGRAEFLVGTAASTRPSAAEARTVGYFVNMLPLACRAGRDATIDTAVQAMQQALADALQHARYPFARIYGDFRREHPLAMDPGRYPLFDLAVTENPGGDGATGDGLGFSSLAGPGMGEVVYELRRNAPPQDMVLVHEGQPGGGLLLTWYVNAAVYTRDTARTWFDALLGWMRLLAAMPPGKGRELPQLLPAEADRLAQWQHGPRRQLPVAAFPDLFRRRAAACPAHPALVTEAGEHNFAEIDARAAALARALREQGVQRGEPVAVLTGRSAVLPQTVLGIWRAGGCYLPLTADLPAERLAFMAADAGPRILIALDGLPVPPELEKASYSLLRPETLPVAPGQAVAFERPPEEPALASDDSAYIIYTSGSTGVPKGVVLRHGGLLNLGLGGAEILGLRADDRVLLIASPSFDLWISDLVMAWSAGAALVPVRREEMDDIGGMRELLRQRGVTAASMSPSYLQLFEQTDLPGLRILMTVGEPPIIADVRHYAAKLAFFNGYGPTENTAASTIGRLRPDEAPMAAGRPLANTTLLILDAHGQPVPPGVVGEIWLAGRGLAAGYLNRPDLSAAAFVETPEGRRYRSGDLGRWLPSGQLQLLGRKDDQVKLRGQRVELGEIEHRLAAFPGVRQAVAVVGAAADQSQVLSAFVTLEAHAAAPTPAQWSAYLAQHLPSYMIPGAILPVAEIPLTDAGKVDRRALLAVLAAGTGDGATPSSAARATPPRNAAETCIAEVWAELLGHPRVAREDHFFELGGSSLKAIAVVGRLRHAFECRVNDLYEHPVLADFARVCRPRPDHLRSVLAALSATWQAGNGARSGLQAEQALDAQRAEYQSRLRADLAGHRGERRPYRHLLLTGATGYLGSYVLRELLGDPDLTVTALVRGADDEAARARLGQILGHYFGAGKGAGLRDQRRLTVLAADLRHDRLQLSARAYGRLVQTVDAVYHCAANVNHVGHYADFHADNVAATRHLLALAAGRKGAPADFHLVSTLSVAGTVAPDETRLFTEYDPAPAVPDDNYYVRTKQEAERWVIAARGELANACIHRIGNITFAADGARLQRNIAGNAFFRQVSAFVRLGAVPLDLPASLSHVDVVARAFVALAGSCMLTHAIHHIETARRERLADFICGGDGMAARVRACDFGAFLERLRAAVDEPQLASVVAETVESIGLLSGNGLPGPRQRRVVVSDRTQALLQRFGIVWPAIPGPGQQAMLRAAAATIGPRPALERQPSAAMADDATLTTQGDLCT